MTDRLSVVFPMRIWKYGIDLRTGKSKASLSDVPGAWHDSGCILPRVHTWHSANHGTYVHWAVRSYNQRNGRCRDDALHGHDVHDIPNPVRKCSGSRRKAENRMKITRFSSLLQSVQNRCMNCLYLCTTKYNYSLLQPCRASQLQVVASNDEREEIRR